MTTHLAIGIDPGATGAIGALRGSEVVLLEDTPVDRIGKRQIPSEHRMADLVRKVLLEIRQPDDAVRCVIELQRGMPRQSSTSVFSIGVNFGAWRGVAAAYGVPFEIVDPRRWKNALLTGLPKGDKASSRVAAARLFPDAELGRRKDQGRADALLLAEYARRQMAGVASCAS